MSVSITIRNVPDDVRDELASRAAGSGQSLQEYLRALFISTASRPNVADVVARARSRVAVTGSRVSSTDILSAREADRR